MAKLIPVGVYGEPGSRGHARLTLADPDSESGWQEYLLSLERISSRWKIRQACEPQSSAALLDKAAFRQAIAPLRQRPAGRKNDNTR